MRTRIVVTIVLLLLPSLLTAGSSPRVYRIEARVFSATAPADGVVRLVLESGKPLNLPFTSPGTSPPVEAIRELAIGNDKIVVDAHGELAIEGGGTAGIELLSAPQVVTEEGFEAAIQSGSTVQFLAPVPDGHFKVQTLDTEGPGVFLKLTPKPRDGKVEISVALTIVTLAGREKVPGLELEVGRPVLNRMEMSSQMVIAPGRWFLVSGMAMKRNSHSDLVLLLLQVSEVGPLKDAK